MTFLANFQTLGANRFMFEISCKNDIQAGMKKKDGSDILSYGKMGLQIDLKFLTCKSTDSKIRYVTKMHISVLMSKSNVPLQWVELRSCSQFFI